MYCAIKHKQRESILLIRSTNYWWVATNTVHTSCCWLYMCMLSLVDIMHWLYD